MAVSVSTIGEQTWGEDDYDIMFRAVCTSHGGRRLLTPQFRLLFDCSCVRRGRGLSALCEAEKKRFGGWRLAASGLGRQPFRPRCLVRTMCDPNVAFPYHQRHVHTIACS